ncbi:MAG: IMP dehydrogenase, partial [Thermoleophilia bacterium]|nr:IMP dehydrogenase [Thermoleophilia bacterium]
AAVLDCAEVCPEAGIPLCADGGIRMPADMAKAIAAGADTVMVGNMFAGATESPGTLLERNGRVLKVHRGMASGGAMARRLQGDSTGIGSGSSRVSHESTRGAAAESGASEQSVPEGVEAVVPYRGDAAKVVNQLVGGLRSAMSYSNARTIPEMHERAKFVRITAAGQIESRPHDVEV